MSETAELAERSAKNIAIAAPKARTREEETEGTNHVQGLGLGSEPGHRQLCTFNERVMARIWATTSRSKRNEEVGLHPHRDDAPNFDAWTWLDEELKEVLSDLVQDMSLRGAQRKKAPAFDGAPPPRNPSLWRR